MMFLKAACTEAESHILRRATLFLPTSFQLSEAACTEDILKSMSGSISSNERRSFSLFGAMVEELDG